MPVLQQKHLHGQPQVIWAPYTTASRSSNAGTATDSSIVYSVKTCADAACGSGAATLPGVPACSEHDCPSSALLSHTVPGLAPVGSVFWCAKPRSCDCTPWLCEQDAMLGVRFAGWRSFLGLCYLRSRNEWQQRSPQVCLPCILIALTCLWTLRYPLGVRDWRPSIAVDGRLCES